MHNKDILISLRNYTDTDILDIEKEVKKHRRKKSCLPASGTDTIIRKGRKPTFEERLEIVTYCITHNHNYTETSEKFSVSYQQTRNYAVKYETGGVDAL